MFVDDEDAKDLKVWVMKRLEDISDADPDVLADYVLALIRSEVPESTIRENTVSQLEDFLRDHAASFVDELLQVVRSRKYTSRPAGSSFPAQKVNSDNPVANLPDSARTDSIPTDAPTFPEPSRQGRKRALRNIQTSSITQFDSQERDDRRHKRGRRGGPSTQNGPALMGPQSLNQATSASQPFGSTATGMPGMGQQFQPNDPQTVAATMLAFQSMGMPVPPGFGTASARPKQPCFDFETKGFCVRGATCPYDHGTNQIIMPQPTEQDPNLAGMFGANFNFPSILKQIADGAGHHLHSPNRRRRRAEFSLLGPNYNRDMTSLVVEQIPEENFEEGQVRSFFEKFGTIEETNMQAYKHLAIVRFSTYEQARRAYESPKAIFDNRFVKVYWYDPNITRKPYSAPKDSSHPQNGDSDKKDVEFDQAEFEKKTAEAQKKHEEREKLKEETETKARELERQRVDLMRKSDEVKRKLHEKLREMGVDSSPAVVQKNGTGKKKHRDTEALKAQLATLEREARELGIDLDIINDDDNDDDHTDYGSYSGSRGRGTYHGRGASRGWTPFYSPRGRGAYWGRTSYQGYVDGPFRGAVHAGGRYNLDLRPRRVRVSTLDGEAWSDEKDHALREFLFNVGEFDAIEPVSIDEDGGVIVDFSDRPTAEAFYYGPREVTGVGKLQLSWVANPPVEIEVKLPDNDEDTVMESGDDDRRDRERAGPGKGREEYDVAEEDERWIVSPT